jgi:hypothetical protein
MPARPACIVPGAAHSYTGPQRWQALGRELMRCAYPAEGQSAAGQRWASDMGGREREEWRRLRIGAVGLDTGGRRLYGTGTWQRCPDQAESGMVRGARWRRGSDAWAPVLKGGDRQVGPCGKNISELKTLPK